jgi:hypothetical protein
MRTPPLYILHDIARAGKKTRAGGRAESAPAPFFRLFTVLFLGYTEPEKAAGGL